jgi:hypothetical protein
MIESTHLVQAELSVAKENRHGRAAGANPRHNTND